MEEIQPASTANSTSHPQLHIIMDIVEADKKWFPSQRRMHKLSPQLRMKKSYSSEPSVYDPIMVSLGPYHHGKEEFRLAEEFKPNCLHWCTNGRGEVKDRFYNMIFSKINEIRGCYAETTIVNKYDDNALALMMLLDACFIINLMEIRVSREMAQHWYRCLGVAGAVSFTARDIMVLENQIPFSVLKLLIFEMYNTTQGKSLLRGFLGAMMSVESKLDVNIPREDEDPPTHILEAFRRMLVGKYSTTDPSHAADHCSLSFKLPRKEKYESRPIARIRNGSADIYPSNESSTAAPPRLRPHLPPPPPPPPPPPHLPIITTISPPIRRPPPPTTTTTTSNYLSTCPSVMYLKEKGIGFRPSSSHFLNDIKFDSHAVSGQLQLPVCYVSDLTLVFLSNTIAYEISPDNMTGHSSDLAVLSYVNFMKSLIQTPSDVRELQKQGILQLNRFGNLEQVVQLFKSIDTFTLRNTKIYQDVMLSVREHCNSKAKTWMADLINGKLKSPWTIIALLSATLLLILAFLQAFYTIHPVKKINL